MTRPARLALAALVLVAPAPAGAGTGRALVTQAAVWRPPAGFMTGFHAQCDGRSGNEFDACFAAAMARAGASPAALEFSRRLGNEGYLQALDPTAGPIAVAHVLYPFRANENEAWLLVNGTPPLIDVDDRQNLPLPQMRASAAYAQIRHHYRNVTFWPGDRGGAQPEVARDGRAFVVGYLLRDLCHACAIVGRVRFAFDFNTGGTFLGTRLVSVSPARK